MHTPILFTGINTEQAHDIGFPSLEVTLQNNVKLSRICRHFGFAMATGGRKPVACSKMLIFSHLVNFGRNFPSSLLRWQNGLGTAWPGREPEVKRPEEPISLRKAAKSCMIGWIGTPKKCLRHTCREVVIQFARRNRRSVVRKSSTPSSLVNYVFSLAATVPD